MQIGQFLNRYGREAVFTADDGWCTAPFHCFIQPLRYKNKMYLYGVNTQIGYNAQGHYLYIGPPEHDVTKLSDDAVLQCDGIKYRIDRAEKVFCGNDVFYIWAVVRTIVEEESEVSS